MNNGSLTLKGEKKIIWTVNKARAVFRSPKLHFSDCIERILMALAAFRLRYEILCDLVMSR